MRVLLDEHFPRKLSREIVGHDISTVQREGRAGLGNGKLLRAASDRGFEAFVTSDQNLQFQQNLQSTALRIVVLHANGNAIEDLRPVLPALLSALEETEGATLRHVHA